MVKQATIMASTPLQKGICSFFMSREGTNQTLRNHAAKKAISKLSTQASLSGTDSLGQIYLALSYLEFYVSQQEMLKKKTEVSLLFNYFYSNKSTGVYMTVLLRKKWLLWGHSSRAAQAQTHHPERTDQACRAMVPLSKPFPILTSNLN